MQKLLIPTSSGLGRENNFDAMRLGFALLVVWSHSFALYYGTEEGEPISRLLRHIFNAGNLAVMGFFVISGLLITHSFVRSKSTMDYLFRRVRRIHPGYLVAMGICVYVVVPLYSQKGFGALSARDTVTVVWKNLLLQGHIPTHGAFANNPNPAVNGAVWSIPFEFWCYLGVIVLGVSGLLLRRVAIAGLVGLVLVVYAWLEVTGRTPGGGIVGEIIGWPYLWFKVLPCFLLGMLAYSCKEFLVRSRWLFLGAMVLPIVTSRLPVGGQWADVLTKMVMPVCMAYCIFYVAFSSTLRVRHAAKYGDFSYGSYLYAFPIQQMVMASWGGRIGFPAYVGLSVVLSLGAGVLSWYGVERWFLAPAKKPVLSPVVAGA